ncbi:MAG TPA: hypothetical protein VGW33_02450 [Terriglobia bacterium]|nr:hypothetical protein [Terriglobia bacterium]
MSGPQPIPPIRTVSRAQPEWITPLQALGHAYDDSLTLLFHPFDLGLWLRLGFICLLLGGGTPTAAFDWSLGSLPGDLGFQTFTGRLRDYVTEHLWLIAVFTTAGLALTLIVLYLRSLFRFVLVDAILKRQVGLRRAWREVRPLGRSYFRWLGGALATVGLALVTGAIAAYPYLRSAAGGGIRSAAFWATLVAVLLVDVVVGLALAIVIVLTDDLAVPLMYAERLPLPAAWRKLARHVAAEPGAFTLYVLLRFAVAVVTSFAVLFFLFPVLLSLFSGAIITGALVVVTLHLLGLLWSWNPFTVALAATALVVLLGLVLVLLSLAGMPAQVFIQDYGIRFVAPRVPALAALLPPSEAGD